jgi:hypothetical protein
VNAPSGLATPTLPVGSIWAPAFAGETDSNPTHLDSGVMQRHLATQGFATLLIDIARAAILMRAPSLKQDVTLAAARSQWLPKPLKGRR